MRYLKAFFIILAAVALAGCRSGDEKPPAKAGTVTATPDFVKHFGPAPLVEKGTAYAFVIYFPSAKEPGRVLPFPFFSFDEASLQKVALSKLVSGMGELKSYKGEIAQPFPAGARVIDVTRKGGNVTATFSKELAGARQDQGAVNAIIFTLSQFEGVDAVRILVEGVPDSLDKDAKKADDSAIVQLGSPRLLSVTAMREKGAEEVEEVDVYFDRPVQIKELRISGADGKPFDGDIYQSVFDMAGVLKPKDAAGFEAGMPVRVRWHVTDKLGRTSSGEGDFTLDVKDH